MPAGEGLGNKNINAFEIAISEIIKRSADQNILLIFSVPPPCIFIKKIRVY